MEDVNLLVKLFSIYIPWYTFFITIHLGIMGYFLLNKESIKSPLLIWFVCGFFIFQCCFAIKTAFDFSKFIPKLCNQAHPFMNLAGEVTWCVKWSVVAMVPFWIAFGLYFQCRKHKIRE